MLYVIIISICAVILSTLNICFFQTYLGLNWWQIILVTIGYIALAILIDAIIALIVNKLPKKWFKKDSKVFKIFKWERKFYEKIGIKKWKDKIPELGKLGNFSKSKVEDPTSVEYIERFILESKIGETVHFIGLFASFILLSYPRFLLCFGLPVAVINLLLNIPSLLILRYNRPKLGVLLERNKRLQQRKREKEIKEAS